MGNENKSKVMRVTEKEERLIKFVRTHGNKAVKEIKKALSELPDKIDYFNMKSVASILEERCFMDLETLIDIGFITTEYAETLISAMETNKNIIIVGNTGVGKTTLLNSLLEYQNNVRMLVYEKHPELFISEGNRNSELSNVVIDVKETNSVELEDVSELLKAVKQPVKRIVYGECWDMNDKLSMITSLNMGISVLSTDFLRGRDKANFNWKTSFKEGFNDGSKGYVKETLNKHRFIIVTLEQVIKGEGRKNKVVKIEEI